MDKKMIYALVVVVIVVIAVIVAGGYLLGWFGGGGTPTPTTVYTMENATSLQYTVNLTTSGVTGTYVFSGKNLGTADIWLRVDATPVEGAGTYSYIMNATSRTSSNNETGTWAAGNFTRDWGVTWSAQFEGYITHNKDWKTGDPDITYHDNAGNEVDVFSILINPSLPDSLFTPPS